MGEAGFAQKAVVTAVQGAISERIERADEALRVDTPGGRFQVRWDENGSATALGQLAFFAEFLEVSGLFERWENSCPLVYTSPNAPGLRDILGTWMLSILDGQRRYAHVTALRGDAVAPQILDMKRIVSDEALRRALARLAPTLKGKWTEGERAEREAQLAGSTAWMDAALAESTREALVTSWILDCDTTVKLLYGHQDGAEVSYNPTKPGRPSHVIHTYWIANIRLVLDAEVQNGKAHAARHGLPRLILLLKALPVEQRPQLVRGDIAFGNDPVMRELEAIEQRYLFKLKQSAGVKRLIEQLIARGDWQDTNRGEQSVDTTLRLAGWDRARRVVVVRQEVKAPPETKRKKGKPGQELLPFGVSLPPAMHWKYAVLVTNSDYDLVAIAQLYRDRGDCENGFDEIKNQWGWGGYTTHDLERCNLAARAVALIYNWWSWYVRLAHPKARREAITSRPLLLAGVARLTDHAGQSRLLITLAHAAGDKIKAMVANVREGLNTILAAAPQLPKPERWKALVRYIIGKILATNPKNQPPPTLLAASPLPLPAG
jgi:hypothetical protein